MDTLGELVEELDQAAETSSSVRVLKVDPSLDLGLVQQRLNNALGSYGTNGLQSSGQPQTQSEHGKPGEGQPGGPDVEAVARWFVN